MQRESPSSAAGNGHAPIKWTKGVRLEAAVFLAVAFVTLFARFRRPDLMLGFYQDDFFYYLKVAQNIASTGVSTFNGIALTNGYHPLWMLVLVALYRLFHGGAFFVVLQIVSLASAVWTWALARRVLSLFLSPSATALGAFLLGMEALMLIRYGMEVTLTLPLAMLLLFLVLRDGVPRRFKQALKLGVLASLLILSRLDAGILVALLCVTLLLPPLQTVRRTRVLLGFLCGVLPLLALYFAVNLHVFHLLTPVSGLAKQMKPDHLPSAATWTSLLPVDRMRALLLLPQLLLVCVGGLVAVLHAPETRGDLDRLRHRVLKAVLLFPLLHLLTLSILSDWPTWPWYFYSITLAAVAGYALCAERWRSGFGLNVLAGSYLAALLVYAGVYSLRGPDSIAVLTSSRQAAAFMDSHPGIYMMGDQAGTTAYLAHQPIIQTEGLVMDRHFLQLMRHGTPLREVAQEYHARYYALIGAQFANGCVHMAEPSNAGPESPRMRGSICHAPLATYYRENDHAPIAIFDAAWIQ